MSLRAFSDRVLNRVIPGPFPPGTTHVLDFVPADPSGTVPASCEYWELWLARDFARGYCEAGNDPCWLDEPAEMDEAYLRTWVEGMLGHLVTLTRFSAEIEADGPAGPEMITVPAYYVARAT